MAFDELTKHQRRLLLELVGLLNSGRYEPLFALRYAPATQFESGRWQVEIQGTNEEKSMTIDVHDENDLLGLNNNGYITARYGETVGLTPKTYEQNRLLTQQPTQETRPSDLLKFWL